jgi:hypothetical protein
MKVVIERFAYAPEGTAGKLTVEGADIDFSCFTVERAWRNNEPWISCIPEGEYECEDYSSDKYPDAVQVKDVKGRTHILFHSANKPTQLAGCIAPGLGWGFNGQAPFVNSSRVALDRLFEAAGKDFTLKITSVSGVMPKATRAKKTDGG